MTGLIPMNISDAPPIPPPEQAWVEDACAAVGVGFSPFFYLDVPAEVWDWMVRRTRADDHLQRKVIAGKRLGYVMEKALENPQLDRPRISRRWWHPSIHWYGGARVELPADMAFHARVWAQRVGLEPRHLLVALAIRAYEQRHSDAPPQEPFTLEIQ